MDCRGDALVSRLRDPLVIAGMALAIVAIGLFAGVVIRNLIASGQVAKVLEHTGPASSALPPDSPRLTVERVS